MTTIAAWSSSASPAWSLTVGSAPSVTSGGTFGERLVWPSTTAAAFVARSGLTLGDFGSRWVYTVASFATSSHSLAQGLDGALAQQWKLDLASTGQLRIRDIANTQVAQSTGVLSAGVEYRIECWRAAGGILNARAYTIGGTLTATVSGAVGASVVERINVGSNATLTGTLGSFTVDEWVLTDVAAEVGPVAGSPDTISAGADTSVEPAAVFTLTATSSGTACVWSQVSGPSAPPVGSGGLTADVARAPMSLTGATLTYRATATAGGATDDVVVSVLPCTDAIWSGAAWVPVLLVTTAGAGVPPSGAPATFDSTTSTFDSTSLTFDRSA
jgi:hypothetical protein